MSNSEIAVFAETTFRNQRKKFGIKSDDRRRHMYLIGKTGMGKSTVLENMIIDDIRAGRGVAVVDPHGDLAEKVMAYIPEERVKDVIYFNPADIDYPIAFNVVEQVDSRLQHLVASGLIGVFQKLWADSWGPRLEYILRNAILAILDYPGSTLLGVVRMLSDKPYRKRVVANIKDPVVKAFWENEFTGYADKFASEAVSPIQNKVGQFLSSSLMRNIVGQIKSSIDLRKVMDEGKILILNLSKGRIGEDNSALLGAMMITKIQLAAMSRVDISEEQRRDFYLYIDEFQNFSTDSFANILSEARKYRLNLILAHQYIEQLNEKVKPAVFGNVGTMIVFRVGASDAEELAKEFLPTFNEEDLVNLPKYEMYLKLMIDGVASMPFSARGLPPLSKAERTGQEEAAIKWSRDHYATPREEVEDQIVRWYQANAEETALNEQRIIRERAVSTSNSKETSALEGFPSICALCGTTTYTPFEPDGVRPVFCKQCLSKKKEERRQELEKKALPFNTPKIITSGHQTPISLASQSVSAPRLPRRPVAASTKSQAVNYQKASIGVTPAKKSNPLKVRPFTPSAMEPFLDKQVSGPALSLSDLAQATLRDFKGQPQKPTEKPASASLKKSSYLESPILDNWPSGEDLEADEEIDFTKK
ncbi:MAG: type IV secretion system DNA-binding domain-containing protein [Patescibacteria group bacterium]|jgi:CxxC-x17-CxxC domain-containing protein